MKKNDTNPQTTVTTKEQGNRGEEIAIEYLRQRHYHILEHQWHHLHYELDIIAEDVETSEIVIVEVKTRTSDAYGNPEDAVTTKKIRRIVSATDFYLRRYNIELPYRFDIISIIINDKDGKYKLNHIKDAFYPPLTTR